MKTLHWLPMGVLALSACTEAQLPEELRFDAATGYSQDMVVVDKRPVAYRAYERIVYVARPVDTTYQQMNVYVPAAYFEGKSINGYTAETAPIFFPNQVGGYMPAQAGTVKGGGFAMPAAATGKPQGAAPTATGGKPAGLPDGKEAQPSTIAQALAHGYVVASAGARGRTTFDSKTQRYTGKAPACIVDLKAAVRYLKANDRAMPGNAERIVSNGTSAGGALSALLGATGNSPDYAPYLKALGAAEADDRIYAVSAYCPITNLDHADAAYEWQFNTVNNYEKIDVAMLDYKVERKTVAGTLTAAQQQVSDDLARSFPAYVNGLHLKNAAGEALTLDSAGNGNFKQLVETYVLASAQAQLDAGADISDRTWLTIENGKAVGMDFDAYVAYMGRMKLPPAFDQLDLSSGENQLFGTETVDTKHFTDYSRQHSTRAAETADATIVRLMNPMDHIGTKDASVAAHWRIRHGSKDKDTGLAVSVLLATLLQNNGIDVDLAFPWDRPHSGDYDLPELFRWIDTVIK